MTSSLKKLDLIGIVNRLDLPKNIRQEALSEIRRIERLEGCSLYGNYNGPRNPSEIARLEEER